MDFFGAGQVIGAAINSATSVWQTDKSADMADHAMNVSASEAEKNRLWQEYMSNTAYRRQVDDLKAAGLNPMLGIMRGSGATTPSGGQGSGFQAHPAEMNIMQGALTASQVEATRAQVDKTRAETREITERTPTHSASIDVMRQNIQESIERIGKIQQDVKTGEATAAQLQQQVTNMREMIPQIRAQTDQLGTLAKLNQAQAIAQLAQAGVSKEQAAEIHQRVAAQLPQLERALGLLEKTAQEMAQPGHMANEAAQSSFIGTMGAYLRALLPIGGVMGAIPIGRLGTGKTPPAPSNTGWAGHGSQHRNR